MLKEPVITVFCYGDSCQDGHGYSSEFYLYTNLEDKDFKAINHLMGKHFGFTMAEDSAHDISYPVILGEYLEDKLKLKYYKILAEKGFKFSFSYTQKAYEKAIADGIPDDEYVENGEIYHDEFKEIVMFIVEYMVKVLGWNDAVFEGIKLPVTGFHGAGYGIFSCC